MTRDNLCHRSVFLSFTECQQLCRFYIQNSSDIKKQVERYGAAEIGSLDCSDVLAADTDTLRKLLLGQTSVLAVICDIVPDFNEFLRVIKFGIAVLCHGPHLY